MSRSLREKSFEPLPALSVRGPELRRCLRLVTVAWMFGSVWMVAIGGATVLNLRNLAGFSERQWGLFATLGFAGTFAQLPASYFVERTGLRKLPFLQTMIAARLLWATVALMPLALFVIPAPIVVWLTIALVFFAHAFNHMGGPAWTSWMADLIPPRIRGRYFAVRNRYAVMVQIAATIALGLLLDRIVPPPMRDALKRGELTAAEIPALAWTLAGIFVAAGLFGAADIWMFRSIREVVRRVPPMKMNLRHLLIDPLKNPRFVRFVGNIGTLTFGVGLGMAWFGPTVKDFLNLDNTATNVVLMVTGPLGGILTSKFWGRQIDRWGRRPVLLALTAGLVIAVWGWLLIPPIAPWNYLVGVVTFFGGVVWTGVGIAHFNLLLSFSDEGGRSNYTAASGFYISAIGFAGGIIGGQICQMLESSGFRLEIGPFVYVRYHVMFLLSGLVRIFSIFWLIGMEDPGAQPARRMMRALRSNVYHGAASLLFVPSRVFGWSVRGTYRINGRDDTPRDEASDESRNGD